MYNTVCVIRFVGIACVVAVVTAVFTVNVFTLRVLLGLNVLNINNSFFTIMSVESLLFTFLKENVTILNFPTHQVEIKIEPLQLNFKRAKSTKNAGFLSSARSGVTM